MRHTGIQAPRRLPGQGCASRRQGSEDGFQTAPLAEEPALTCAQARSPPQTVVHRQPPIRVAVLPVGRALIPSPAGGLLRLNMKPVTRQRLFAVFVLLFTGLVHAATQDKRLGELQQLPPGWQ